MISGQIKGSDIHIGDKLKIHSQVVEGAKTRIQIFEGILISLSGRGENAMFTIRRISPGGVGVERTWPVNGKSIVKVEVSKKTSGVRRAKLYYLRDRIGKAAVRI